MNVAASSTPFFSRLLIAALLQLLISSSQLQCATAQRVTAARFIDANEENYIPVELTPKNVIDYRVLAHVKKFNILVETAPNSTASVFITLDRPKLSFCERKSPFGVFRNSFPKGGGPHGLGLFQGKLFKLGNRVLEATPYAGEKCKGRAGPKFRMEFQVVNTTGTVPREPVSLQPKVTTVEQLPARKLAGILDLGTRGTPWCGGNPTYWVPGHKSDNDTPNCFVNGTWTRPFTAQMDDTDELNDIDGPEVIDRHDCGVLDVNNDGLLDVYCLVGANSGRGHGFSELYLTRPNGSIRKVKRHGLQKHLGMRGRYTTVVRGPDQTDDYVFMATKGVPRADDLSNTHRMYRKTGGVAPFFEEVEGPWITYTNSSFAQTIDFNGDGLDDIFVGNLQDYPLMYLQGVDNNGESTWEQVPLNQTRRQWNWRNARVADFTGDGIADLLVVYFGDKSFIRIFKGIRQAPFFDFTGELYYSKAMPHEAPDFEVLDVNGDGMMDFYVVQSDEVKQNADGSLRERVYCAGKFLHRDWWRKGNQPPADFVPPLDTSNDFLFIGKGPGERPYKRFDQVTMEHSEPGCGNIVRPFGDKRLLLTQGDFVRPGHQLVLDWN